METLQSWYNLTVEHSMQHNLESPNRFTVSPVLMAPQLYSVNQAIARLNAMVREVWGKGGLAYLEICKKGKGLRQHAGAQETPPR